MNEEIEYGSYHKLWFAISIGLSRILDYLVVSAFVSGLLAFLLGSQYYVVFWATGALGLLLRLAIMAFNWKTARFLPMDTEYRVSLVEDRIGALESVSKSKLRGVSNA